jgi:GNAT superfamily N-acetyltransferase
MENIATKDPNFFLRFAVPDDASLIVDYMRKLGAFQKMADEITATEAQIRRLLDEKWGEALIATYKDENVGFVYFCEKSSAFTGRSGLYIDGFLVDEKLRGKGLGKIMMQFMCQLGLDRKCEMLEWGCLDWNEPAIQFYRKMGAYSIDAMTIYRFGPKEVASNASMFV